MNAPAGAMWRLDPPTIRWQFGTPVVADPGGNPVATMSVLSTLDCQVRVFVTNPDGTDYNPTGDAVQMAFMPTPPDNIPGVGDWHTGSWVSAGNGAYLAQCLVGPANGGVPLTEGVYTVWVQITDNPEVPTEPVGQLTVSP